MLTSKGIHLKDLNHLDITVPIPAWTFQKRAY